MRPPFPYVQSFVDKQSGKVFHYFRRRGYRRVRLPLPGSREQSRFRICGVSFRIRRTARK
jgi:hypothetical protein